MTLTPQDLDAIVERLLLEWWEWERRLSDLPAGITLSPFYAELRLRNAGYDSVEILLSEDTDHVRHEAVGAAVASLPVDHLTAVHIFLLNATAGNTVWRSNRLGDRQEALYAEAKQILVPLLRKRNVELI